MPKIPTYVSLPLMLVAAMAQAQNQGQTPEVEEIVVIGRQEFLATQFTAKRTASNVDAAKLINEVPGGAATSNGPLTGQIQYRGMFGPRVNVRVDGMLIHGGGPNWMAPPLQHIPSGLMETLVIEQGIPSIATGGGIGGAATAYWKKPDYNYDSDWKFSGDTEAAFGSADAGSSYSGVFGLSNDAQRFFVVGSFDEGDDYESQNGTVAATQYSRDVYGAGYGAKFGVNEFNLDFHRMKTDDTGTPSLPMDIDFFDTDIWNASYSTTLGGFGLEFRVYGSDIDHGMSNHLLRPAPDFSNLPLPPFVGDDKREIAADSKEHGYKFTLDTALAGGNFIAGVEGKSSNDNSTVYDPDFAPFFVDNANGTDYDSRALFAQWSSLRGARWYWEAGARVDNVEMNTGEVDAFPARLVDMNPSMWSMGTPPRAVYMLREAFNAADRSREDTTVDWVLKSRYQATDEVVVEVGVAQKSRVPMYQERYLWIPLEANAGLGDGNNYVGSLDLDPEVSMQYELGFDWDFGTYYFSPRIYLRKVDDFIQGVPATNMAVIGVSANANGDPTPLMFANTEATFKGIDLTFGAQVSTNWRVEGLASYVKAKRDDIDDNLYRIAPASLRVSLIYEANDFSARLQQVFIAEQDDLSRTNTYDPTSSHNSYEPTDGYMLTNLSLNWQLSTELSLSAGAENMFDTDYEDHLSGFNRVNAGVVPVGHHLYGQGRNFFARAQYVW